MRHGRMLELSATIQGEQQRLEELREQVRELEAERASSDEVARQRIVESGQVEMSVRNLYVRCLESAGAAPHMQVEAPRSDAPPGAPMIRDRRSDLAQLTRVIAELERYMSESLTQVAKRLTDLRSVVEGYPSWIRAEATAAEQAAERAARVKQDEALARAAREAAVSDARRRVLMGRARGRAGDERSGLLEGDGGVDSSAMGGGPTSRSGLPFFSDTASIRSGSINGGGGSDSMAGSVVTDSAHDGGAPRGVARQLAGNTYVVRLGGGGGGGGSSAPGGAGAGPHTSASSASSAAAAAAAAGASSAMFSPGAVSSSGGGFASPGTRSVGAVSGFGSPSVTLAAAGAAAATTAAATAAAARASASGSARNRTTASGGGVGAVRALKRSP